MNDNRLFWGKTFTDNAGGQLYYPLIQHLLDTATAMKILFDHWLRRELKELFINALESEENALAYLMYSAGLHDIGKINPVFQGMLTSGAKNREIHNRIIEQLLVNGYTIDVDGTINQSCTLRKKMLNRHEKIGFFFMSGKVNTLEEKSNHNAIQLSTLGHHGKFEISLTENKTVRVNSDSFLIDKYIYPVNSNNPNKSYETFSSKIVNSLRKSLNIDDNLLNTPLENTLIILLSGLVILADRLASNDLTIESGIKYAKTTSNTYDSDHFYKYIEDRYDDLYKVFSKELGAAPELTVRDILGDFTPRGIQEEIIKDRIDGLWIAMVQTGAGKTEAALLRHRQYRENLIFLLPTISTTNAIFGRLQKVFSENNTLGALSHSAAFLEDFYNGKKGIEESCGLIPTGFSKWAGANLSAPVTVASIDQAVKASLPIKWTHLRLLLLANSHIVIDEAHLLDHYQITLLKELLSFLKVTKTRISILSATLPNWQKEELLEAYYGRGDYNKAEFPTSVTFEEDNETGESLEKSTLIQSESYDVDFGFMDGDSVEKHLEWVDNILESNPSARLGVFVNQIDRAQRISLEAKKKYPDLEVICLHSRMLAKHRKDTVESLLKKCGKHGKAERILLVGTQVVEMSLDIDLDFVSTDAAPAPNILQRIGRQWRDKSLEAFASRRRRCASLTGDSIMKVNIVVDDLESKVKHYPYSLNHVERTVNFLRKKKYSLIVENSNFSDSKTPIFFQIPKNVQDFVEESVTKITDKDEQATELFKKYVGKSNGILLSSFITEEKLVSDFTELTYGTDRQEYMTRLIEVAQEPFIIFSDDENLIKLGALDSNKIKSNNSVLTNSEESSSVLVSLFSAQELKMATISISRSFSKSFDDLKVPKLENDFGFIGFIPKGFEYDTFVGFVRI